MQQLELLHPFVIKQGTVFPTKGSQAWINWVTFSRL